MPQIRERDTNNVPLPSSETLPAQDIAPVNQNGRVPNDAVPFVDAHPLAHLAGKYNDEPLWDDFLQAMQEVRRQMNAAENTAE